MKNIILFPLVFLCSMAQAVNIPAGTPIETAALISQLMKPAIEAKDGPATCWFLGQVQGYTLALRNTGVQGGEELFNLVKKSAGACGGGNEIDLKKTFTDEEWARLSELQKKIEAYKK